MRTYRAMAAWQSLRIYLLARLGEQNPTSQKPFSLFKLLSTEASVRLKQSYEKSSQKKVQNPVTDYNAFFEQISVHVKNKKLVLKPISIVMLSDGIPDAPNRDGKQEYRTIKVKALENLARDINLTSAIHFRQS